MESKNLNNKFQDESGRFVDLNFKLLAIEALYLADLFEPFDNEAAGFDYGEIEPTNELPDYYGPFLPAVESYAGVQLRDSELALIEDLLWDGGNEVFLTVAPNWDGEDDLFDIRDFESDLEHFPNLKSFTASFPEATLERLQREYPHIEFLEL